MMAWAEREKKWNQLEDSFEKKMGRNEEAAAFPDPPRHQKLSWNSGGTNMARGGDNNSEENKVHRVYQKFMSHEGLMEGRVPKASTVLAWLQDEDIAGSMQDARRIVVALDPCDLEGDVAS